MKKMNNSETEYIEKLPFYDEYLMLLEGGRLAEKEIEDMKNPEKKFQKMKKFYENLGADYTKNHWMAEIGENLEYLTKGEDSRLSQLKRTIQFRDVLKNAVEKQDKDSIMNLYSYINNENYGKIVRTTMFFLGVSQAKADRSYIDRACKEIVNRYTPSRVALFNEYGCYYYLYYLQCLKIYLKTHVDDFEGKKQIGDRCLNLKLMFRPYYKDMFVGDKVVEIIKGVLEVEKMITEAAPTV